MEEAEADLIHLLHCCLSAYVAFSLDGLLLKNNFSSAVMGLLGKGEHIHIHQDLPLMVGWI